MLLAVTPLACKSATAANPALLTANVADPAELNAVSDFNSCVGHPFPQPNSPNSAKNYFWPTSTNFSSNAVLKLFAACDGVTGQNTNDTNDPGEFTRGQTIHLYCDGGSTGLRYFHINYPPGSLGKHVSAGSFLGYAAMVGDGQTLAAQWQNSGNFDIAVIEGDDSRTSNYFVKLDAATFAAWSVRGLTAVSQTFYGGNTACASYSSTIGSPGIFVFSPLR